MAVITWDPNDPRGTDPVAGQDGHFDHHTWLKLGLVEAHLQIADNVGEIASLTSRVADLESRVAALEAKVP